MTLPRELGEGGPALVTARVEEEEPGVGEVTPRPARPAGRAARARALVALLAGLSLLAGLPPPHQPAAPEPIAEHLLRRVTVNGRPPRSGERGLVFVHGDAVFGWRQPLSLAPQAVSSVCLEEQNHFRQARPVRLRLRLRAEDGRPMSPSSLRGAFLNDRPLGLAPLAKENGEVEAEVKTCLGGQANRIGVELGNPLADPLRAVLDVSWSDDPGEMTLHVLAVGVSRYPSARQLRFAHRDAIDLAMALKASQGRLFKRVVVHPDSGALVEEQASREGILAQLETLKQADEHDLAVLIFSGHGDRLPGTDYYYFLPWEYDPDQELGETGLAWDVMRRCLGGVKCRLVLIMDTCHSGAIGARGRYPGRTVGRAVLHALEHFPQGRRGTILVAACLSDQVAAEVPELGHGALSLAILECLCGGADAGRTSPEQLEELHKKIPGGVITLADVHEYADRRVEQLLEDRNPQAVILCPMGDISPRQIPLAIYAPSR